MRLPRPSSGVRPRFPLAVAAALGAIGSVGSCSTGPPVVEVTLQSDNGDLGTDIAAVDQAMKESCSHGHDEVTVRTTNPRGEVQDLTFECTYGTLLSPGN